MSDSKILECEILKMHETALNLLRTLSPCFCQDRSSTTQSEHYVKSLWYAKNLIVRKCHLNLYYSACRRSFISKAFLCYYRNSKKKSFIYRRTIIHFLTKKRAPQKNSPDLSSKKCIQQKLTQNWKVTQWWQFFLLCHFSTAQFLQHK